MAGRNAVKAVKRHSAPAWWRDAKLGIFIHWTPASVPAFAPLGSPVGELMASGRRDAMAMAPYSEWYENSLRFPGSPTARHHAARYPGRAYKEFAGDWEAALDRWDPDAWAEQFARAGARYVVLVAKHHDGYCLWPTSVTNPRRPGWNCRRDVVGELAEAVRARGLRFGLYYSGGLDWTFNAHPIGTFSDLLAAVPRGDYVSYAEAHVRELIDRYRPAMLWNDISWPAAAGQLALLVQYYYRLVPDGVLNDRFMPWSPILAAAGRRPVSRLLDGLAARSAAAGKGIVPPRPPMYDVRTPEYTVFDRIQREPWECVRGLDQGFAHNGQSREGDFLPRDELLWMLVDIVAKGGNLLLNVGPRGDDAAIPPLQSLRLDWLAEFTGTAGHGLYASRPWTMPGSDDRTCDVRYTACDQDVFAFVRPGSGEPSLETAVLPVVEPRAGCRVSDAAGRELQYARVVAGTEVKLAEPASRERPAVLRLRGASAAACT
ncbi:MAG: alpha-L-fucosidase [Acidimicrobiales bacterium]